MIRITTALLRFALVAAFIMLAAAEPSCAQKKGDFDEMLPHGDGTRAVSFLVPTGYTASKKWPVVIGFHPYQTPQTAMRQMLQAAATQLNVILACPDDQPDYDGTITLDILAYLKKNYNIDESNIVLTGYSAGGGGTFGFGLANYQLFKGLIGIATSPYYPPSSIQPALKSLPIGFVVGTGDQYYGAITNWISQAQPYGAVTKLIEKSGVGHTGQYFWSTEFTADWVELYNFVQKTVFPPGDVVLLAPDNGAEEVKSPTKFTWNKAPKAKNYEFQIAELDDFKKLTETKTITDSFYSVKTLKKNTIFYWRVRAKNDGGNGNWSATRYFTTEATIPVESPILHTPEDGAEGIAIPVAFEWDIIEKATKYHIQITEKNKTTPTIDDKTIPAPDGDVVQYSTPNLKKGVEYTWKVRGTSADGDGPWSEIYSFKTQAEAPTQKAALSYPPNNMEKVQATIKLEWGKVEGAESYELQLREDGSQEPAFEFSNIPAGGNLVEYEVTGLKPSTIYWWKVKGKNEAGEGPWSDEYKFTTDNFVSVYGGMDFVANNGIHPNPATDYVSIELNLQKDSKVYVNIYSLAGECILEFDAGSLQTGKNNIRIDSGDLKAGTYLLQVKTGEGSLNKKLVIYR